MFKMNTSDNSSTNQQMQTVTSYQLLLQCLVLVIGFIGTAGNLFVIVILVSTKGTSKVSTSVLILNQLAIDMYSCICLVATYANDLRSTRLQSKSSNDVVVCMLLDSEMLLWFGLNGSTPSLIFIAAERYAKIVHPLLHRRYFRSWMTYSSIALFWFNGVLLTAPVTVITTKIVNGRCYAYSAWPEEWQQISFGVYYFIWDFLGPTLLFVYFYWHIAIVIRARVKGQRNSANNNRSNGIALSSLKSTVVTREQMSGIKTAVIIAIFFVVCCTPNQICFLLTNLNFDLSMLTDTWHGTLFVV